jgi:hypothetical protein
VAQDPRLKPLWWLAQRYVEDHRDDQETIAAALALQLFPLWGLMRFEELDDTTVPWLQASLPIIQRAYQQSQHVTARFVQNYRWALNAEAEPIEFVLPRVEIPAGVPVHRGQQLEWDPLKGIEAPAFNNQQVATNLVVNGPVKVKAAMPGPEQDLMEAAQVQSTGAAIRQAANGGREVTKQAVKRDRIAIGWARVTDAAPCYYCALLASRGAVYKENSFAASDQRFKANPDGSGLNPEMYNDVAKVHDNCRCMLRPVYFKYQAMDSEAKHYLRLWNKVAGGRSNANAIKEFRRQYKPLERPARPEFRPDEVAARIDGLRDAGFEEGSPQVAWARDIAA